MTIVAEAVAAVSATIVDKFFEIFTGRRREDRERCGQAAAQLAKALTALVEELRLFESRRRPKRWKKLLRQIYATLDQLEPVLPHEWRHLKRSIRDSVGSAVGGSVVFVDLIDVPDDTQLASPSRWTMHAADYLEGACRAVRRWGAAPTVRNTKRATLPDYNTWLTEKELQD